jgi:hypothetical protein
MRPTLYRISRAGSGRLATMPRPRGGDWLPDDFRDLALADITVVVSLLTEAEAAELGLGQERDAAAAAGLENVVELAQKPELQGVPGGRARDADRGAAAVPRRLGAAGTGDRGHQQGRGL